MTITFTIAGKPFAKQRPRVAKFGTHARVYTPKETVSFERTVGQVALPHFPSPMSGPVKLTMIAVFQPADSWSGKRKRDALGQPHTQKPDLDNCLKAIKDGLNRIAWGDDAQVAEVAVRKVWGETECTIITIEPLMTLHLRGQIT